MAFWAPVQAIPRCGSARSPGSSAEVPASVSDSDFELNPSSELIDALQPDSGSDFELTRPRRQRRIRIDPAPRRATPT